MDITAAALATIISTCIATTVTFIINRRNDLKSLNDQLDDILKIGIQYPYLESPKFTETWCKNKDVDDEKYLRYDNYCTLVFNFLERYCAFYDFNKAKIEKQHVNIKDWVRLHKQCWQDPTIPYENAESYPEKFKKLINGYIQ